MCVNGPGVPLGGNYRRGSISAASCFRSPLFVAIGSVPGDHHCLITTLYVPLYVSLQRFAFLFALCVFPCAFDGFIPCLFYSQLTDSICVFAGVCLWVRLYCTSLSVCSPFCLSVSSPASKLPAGPPLSRQSARRSAAFKLNKSLGIIAGCGRPLLQSAASDAALSLMKLVCVDVWGLVSLFGKKKKSRGWVLESKPWNMTEEVMCYYSPSDWESVTIIMVIIALTRLAPLWCLWCDVHIFRSWSCCWNITRPTYHCWAHFLRRGFFFFVCVYIFSACCPVFSTLWFIKYLFIYKWKKENRRSLLG